MNKLLAIAALAATASLPSILLAQDALAPGSSFTPLKEVCLQIGMLPGWVQYALAGLGSSLVATLLSNFFPPTTKFGRFLNVLGGYIRKS